ncbi:MAG: S9 family peptidase [Wenzhouxiangella sp.]|nr:MAG: S9 family peptidase [Wenzhouxiangella sp.]
MCFQAASIDPARQFLSFLSAFWPGSPPIFSSRAILIFSKALLMTATYLYPIMTRIAVALSVMLALPAGNAWAGPAEVALEWGNFCETTVCRATGHDGVFDARLSPDASQAVITVFTPGRQGLHLLDIDSGELDFLTEGTSPAWFGDGQRVVFVRDSNIHLFDLAKGNSRALTDDSDDVRLPRPSPDGSQILFASGRSGHQDLWLVATDGESAPRRLTEASMDFDETRFGHAWSPDGRYVAYISNRAEFWEEDLWLVDIENGQTRQLSSGFMARGIPSFSPDGSTIAVYGTDKTGFWYLDMSDIYLVDAGGNGEQSLAMQKTAMEVSAPAWSADGSELFFAVHERGELELWRVPSSGGVATRVTHMGGVIHGFDVSANGERFALVRSTPVRGRELDLVEHSGGQARQLTEVATHWAGVQAPIEISYRSRDGLYIQAFKFLPPDFDPGQPYPTVVQVHGGGTNSYYNGLNLVEQRLAQQGYVVLAVNYRGGSGFGRGFQDMAVEDWANTQSLDAADAAHWIRRQSWSNGKVGIYGYSYGGIISLGAVTRDLDAFDAAVPMGGIYDFADAYENADRLGRLFTREGHRGTPEDNPEAYRRSDSVALLDQVRTPILMLHGEADIRAPFRQFELVVEALERHERTFEAVSYPDQPHQFTDPSARVDMYSRLEAWMDRWLKGGER